MSIEIVKCTACKATLGHVENGNIFRFKRRDCTIEVEDGKRISIGCYQCGKTNNLYDDKHNDIENITS